MKRDWPLCGGDPTFEPVGPQPVKIHDVGLVETKLAVATPPSELVN